MTLKMFLTHSGRFFLRIIGYYFATLIVLALLFPEVEKYQIIFVSWLTAALVVVLNQKRPV